MNRRQWIAVLALTGGLVGLQQGLLWVGRSGWFVEQASLIREQNLDPAAFFYTDSPEARRAEKEVRRRVKHLD